MQWSHSRWWVLTSQESKSYLEIPPDDFSLSYTRGLVHTFYPISCLHPSSYSEGWGRGRENEFLALPCYVKWLEVLLCELAYSVCHVSQKFYIEQTALDEHRVTVPICYWHHLNFVVARQLFSDHPSSLPLKGRSSLDGSHFTNFDAVTLQYWMFDSFSTALCLMVLCYHIYFMNLSVWQLHIFFILLLKDVACMVIGQQT